jgi:4'-phosphopantetheinyl transferase
MSANTWALPPAKQTLDKDDVHIWRAPLDVPSLQRYKDCLAEDEISRANRFVFQKDRDHYIAARGQLRHLLSLYLPQKPGEFQFNYSSYGKPSLGDDHELNFNLSHSGKLVLYAFTHRRELGVDIEFIKPDFTGIDIAEHYFSANEVAVFRSLPEHTRHDAFFTCWTRKEAYIKAIGEGLSCPLDQFDVAFAPGETPKLLANRANPREVTRWSLHELTPGAGYKAALCVEGLGLRLSCWQFPTDYIR